MRISTKNVISPFFRRLLVIPPQWKCIRRPDYVLRNDLAVAKVPKLDRWIASPGVGAIEPQKDVAELHVAMHDQLPMARRRRTHPTSLHE